MVPDIDAANVNELLDPGIVYLATHVERGPRQSIGEPTHPEKNGWAHLELASSMRTSGMAIHVRNVSDRFELLSDLARNQVVDQRKVSPIAPHVTIEASSPEAAARLALGVDLVRGGANRSALAARVYWTSPGHPMSMIRLYSWTRGSSTR